MTINIISKLIEAEAERLTEQIAPRLVNKFLPIIEQRVQAAVAAAIAAAFMPLTPKDFEDGVE